MHTTAGTCRVGGDVICELGSIHAHKRMTVTVRVRAGGASGTPSDRVVIGTASLDPTLVNNVDAARVRIVRHRCPVVPCGSAGDVGPATAHIAC